MNEIVDDSVTKIVQHAARTTQPKFDTITDVEITYSDGGRWHKVDVNMHELLNLLHTGVFDDRQVCAVKVFVVNCNNEEEDVVSFIYDFMLLHTERNPWRIA